VQRFSRRIFRGLLLSTSHADYLTIVLCALIIETMADFMTDDRADAP
jgi:hypothetical protein